MPEPSILTENKPSATRGTPEATSPLRAVRAVIPCHNRPRDLHALLADLTAALPGSRHRVRLRITVIDNASDPPLAQGEGEADARILRLDHNAGGSGGFNAGIAAALAEGTPDDFIWLLDSDARLEPGALLPLVEALERDPTLAAAASALADPHTGQVFETGGTLDPRTGEYLQNRAPMFAGSAANVGPTHPDVIDADYAAACSLLVRRSAIHRAGPMADLFLNGDDVEWCVRLRRRTGQRIAIVPASRVRHPRPDRMRTAARYYAARNAFGVIAAWWGGRPPRRVIFRRALREVGRALAMTMLGRDDLARLHLRGLEDAARGIKGPAPAGRAAFEAFKPLTSLPEQIRLALADGLRGRVMLRAGALAPADEAAARKALHAACVDPTIIAAESRRTAAPSVWRALTRLFRAPPCGLAIVPARAYPEDWLIARTIISTCPEGFAVRRLSRPERAGRILSTALRGLALATRLAWRPPPAPRVEPPAAPASSGTPTLSVVILHHNRADALGTTLEALSADPATRNAEIIIADNASAPGTLDRLRVKFRDARFIDLPENKGIAGFNAGAARAKGEVLLILDDDARPAEGVVAKALDLLATRPDLAAVTLHPRHPDTERSEWDFVRAPDVGATGVASSPRQCLSSDRFPVMGCANLVRRDAWRRVGGYDEAYFLYRNDTDLALKLLAHGDGVYFDPAWVVWHDTPAAAGGRKSVRWHELATRNWVYLCRRHARGRWKPLGILLGWLHAHKLAGRSPRAHWHTLWGLIDGLWSSPPPLPETCLRDGKPFESLMRMRLS